MLKKDMTLALSDKAVCHESSCTEGLNISKDRKRSLYYWNNILPYIKHN
jgi:hypothetical protein